jgi:uncharacterized membrane protein YqhA
MKPVYYFLIFGVIVIAVMIKIIFGSYSIFVKSLMHHFFPDEVVENPLDAFPKKHDSSHKLNLLYAVILVLAILTFFIFIVPSS